MNSPDDGHESIGESLRLAIIKGQLNACIAYIKKYTKMKEREQHLLDSCL